MSDGPVWFEPKAKGYGAGLPVAWQGWVLLIAYVVIMTALSIALTRHMLVFLAVSTAITGVFVLIAAKTTRGGWRWRSGKGVKK